MGEVYGRKVRSQLPSSLAMQKWLIVILPDAAQNSVRAISLRSAARAAEPQAVRRGGQGYGTGLLQIVGRRSIGLAVHRHLPHRRPGPVGFWLRGFVSRLSARRARRIVEAGQ